MLDMEAQGIRSKTCHLELPIFDFLSASVLFNRIYIKRIIPPPPSTLLHWVWSNFKHGTQLIPPELIQGKRQFKI
jgi:hypothetical protein